MIITILRNDQLPEEGIKYCNYPIYKMLSNWEIKRLNQIFVLKMWRLTGPASRDGIMMVLIVMKIKVYWDWHFIDTPLIPVPGPSFEVAGTLSSVRLSVWGAHMSDKLWNIFIDLISPQLKHFPV